MLLSYKPLHLEAQQRLQEEGCVVDIIGAILRMKRPVRVHDVQKLIGCLVAALGKRTLAWTRWIAISLGENPGIAISLTQATEPGRMGMWPQG